MKVLMKQLALVITVSLVVAGCDGSDDEPMVNTAPQAQAASVIASADTVFMGQLVGSDSDGDSLTFSVADEPQNGAVMIAANGSYSYTPNAEYVGDDSFSFRVSDGALTATATVSIRIDALAVSLRSVVRQAYEQTINDEPLTVNARDFQQDVLDTAEFDDLVAAGEVGGND
ncbi:MAG: Uncharacterised protein [Pseudidiomarina mangrovi]|nr:MAG: Uncharacterised protein [Pseudidiomarina mangrovi]